MTTFRQYELIETPKGWIAVMPGNDRITSGMERPFWGYRARQVSGYPGFMSPVYAREYASRYETMEDLIEAIKVG